MAKTTPFPGAAREHHAMSELLRQGYIAELALQCVPNMDIVVTDMEGKHQCAVQIKSRLNKGSDGGWHTCPKHRELEAQG